MTNFREKFSKKAREERLAKGVKPVSNKGKGVFAERGKDLYSIKNVDTKGAYMEYLAGVYGASIEEMKEVAGVGEITSASDSLAGLMLIDDSVKKMRLLNVSLSLIFSDNQKERVAGKKYRGLIVSKLVMQAKQLKMVVVTPKMEQLIIDEMLDCDFADEENINKILQDLNDMFRYYQELSIDSAKKMYKFSTIFYNSVFRAESTFRLKHNFSSFRKILGRTDRDGNVIEEAVSFEIGRDTKYRIDRNTSIGDAKVFINEYDETKIDRVVYKDQLGAIQSSTLEYVENIVNNELKDVYTETCLSDETIEDFAIVQANSGTLKDVYSTVVIPYMAAVSNRITALRNLSKEAEEEGYTKEEVAFTKTHIESDFDNEMERISNYYRYLTKDIDMAEAGKILFAASNIRITKEGVAINKESSNKCYLYVAPELFMAYFTKRYADVDYALEPVYNPNGLTGKLYFVNGLYGTASLECDYTGNVEIENASDENAKIYFEDILNSQRAEVELNNIMLPIISGGNNKQKGRSKVFYDPIVFIKNSKIVEISADEFLKPDVDSNGNVVRENKRNIFVDNKCEKIKLYPIYKYKDQDGKNKKLYDVIVATVNLKNGSQADVPVCKYSCNSSMLEDLLAGLEIESPKISYNKDMAENYIYYFDCIYSENNKDKSVNRNHVDTENIFGEVTSKINYNSEAQNENIFESNKENVLESALRSILGDDAIVRVEKDEDVEEDVEEDFFGSFVGDAEGSYYDEEVYTNDFEPVDKSMTKEELLAVAEERGISIKKSWNKTKLIEVINAYGRNESEPEADTSIFQ